jgi:iron complex outermembrane receptor protein
MNHLWYLAIAAPFLAQSLCAQPLESTLPDTTRLGEVVVTATRSRDTLARVPYAVSVVERPPHAEGLSLEETLELAPGVQVDNRSNFAVGDRIAVRGVGARSQFGVRGVKVIVDDIPATFADGQTALEGIDPRFVERAEVVRGAASMLYGNAAGGAIVMSTASTTARAGVAISGTGGPQSYYARVPGAIGPIESRLLASYTSYGGWREHSDATLLRTSIAGTIGSNRTDTLGFRAAFTRLDASNPGSLNRVVADSAPTAAHPANVQQGTGKTVDQFEIGASVRKRKPDHELGVAAWMIVRTVDNPIIGRRILLERTAFGARIGAATSLADSLVTLDLGLDLDGQFDDRENRAPASEELLLDQRERVVSYGPYLLASMHPLPGVRLHGAIRYDQVTFSVVDDLVDSSDGDDSGERAMSALSPSLGVAWTPLDALTFFANVATGFETPTTTELANRPDGSGGFNPELEPQRSLSFEAGARIATAAVAFEAVGYHMRVADELIPFEVQGQPGRDYFRNAGSAVHRGVEVSLVLRPIERLRLHASGALTDARFEEFAIGDDRFDGNRVPGVAPLSLSAGARYTIAGLTIGLDLRHQSETAVDDANGSFASAYALVGGRIGYGGFAIALAGRAITIAPYLGIDNALDTRYSGSIVPNAAGGRYYEPGRGRTVYGGIEVEME